MTERILVTGATGTVGRHVVAALADRGAAVRSAVRDPDSALAEVADAGEAVAFDFAKPETWGDALAGVDGDFLRRPPTVNDDHLTGFVDAAARVGVDRVASLSAPSAER